MKKLTHLIVVFTLSVACLLSCKDKSLDEVDENNLPNNTYWGTANAVVNGETHICKSAASLFNSTGKINLTLAFDVIPDYLRHKINIRNLPAKVGDYALADYVPLWDEQPESVFFGWYSQDAVISFYHQMQDSTFLLKVTKLDTVANEISGTYSGVFVTDLPGPENPAPDTVRFEQGVFSTKIGRQ